MAEIMLRLDEKSLRRDPAEVFDILEKIGEGSYGSVVKAIHKESGRAVAIKQVPVEGDLQEIVKEIGMMQQCDWPHVVQYYGSYFKNSELWIVMEFCGAGSVADIMRLRRRTMTESQIACITKDTLKALEYLHSKRKIHRDIKAGNILLTKGGVAKLADFGVAGQLSDTMAKRNTLIGTPFWMAPEVIQEVGYNTLADIWSLGITLIEMSEGKPPHADVHPMRAIFMIPTAPAPRLSHPDHWSPDFVDLVAQCLTKRPEERPDAAKLLQHPFGRKAAKPGLVLAEAIEEAMEILSRKGRFPEDHDPAMDSTRSTSPTDAGTLVQGSMMEASHVDGTFIVHDFEDSGTMVVSADPDQEDFGTMKHNLGHDHRLPAFMQQFELQHEQQTAVSDVDDAAAHATELKTTSVEELRRRLDELQPEMDREIAELRARYQAKRQPILDAIETKQRAAAAHSS